jgi:hypothetical protein
LAAAIDEAAGSTSAPGQPDAAAAGDAKANEVTSVAANAASGDRRRRAGMV